MDKPIVKENDNGYEVKLRAGLRSFFISHAEYKVSSFLINTATAEEIDADDVKGMRDLMKAIKAIEEHRANA